MPQKTALVIKEQCAIQETNINSDLALYQALKRRTLAMDLTGLATFEVSKKWIARICFNLFTSSSTRLSEGESVTAPSSGSSFIVRLSETFIGNLKVAPMGLPLDPLIERFETDMSVTCYMLPIPASQTAPSVDKPDKK